MKKWKKDFLDKYFHIMIIMILDMDIKTPVHCLRIS
jgi:hypothetical protein